MAQHQETFPTTGNVRANQAAPHLAIALSTFWKYVAEGKIKRPIKYGKRVSVWSAEYIRSLGENGIPDKVEV